MNKRWKISWLFGTLRDTTFLSTQRKVSARAPCLCSSNNPRVQKWQDKAQSNGQCWGQLGLPKENQEFEGKDHSSVCGVLCPTQPWVKQPLLSKFQGVWMTQPLLFHSIMILSDLEEESQGKILVVLSENICATLLWCLELDAPIGNFGNLEEKRLFSWRSETTAHPGG